MSSTCDLCGVDKSEKQRAYVAFGRGKLERGKALVLYGTCHLMCYLNARGFEAEDLWPVDSVSGRYSGIWRWDGTMVQFKLSDGSTSYELVGDWSLPSDEEMPMLKGWKDDSGTPTAHDTVRRMPGCQCHWEEGDSPCPVHGDTDE